MNKARIKPFILIFAQTVLFLGAFILFYAGLFFGLQVNPTVGSILWILSGIVFLVDVLWIFFSLKNSRYKFK